MWSLVCGMCAYIYEEGVMCGRYNGCVRSLVRGMCVVCVHEEGMRCGGYSGCVQSLMWGIYVWYVFVCV